MNLIDLENVRFRSSIGSIEDHHRFVLFHRDVSVRVRVNSIDVSLRWSNEHLCRT